jgi:hypothetical protein
VCSPPEFKELENEKRQDLLKNLGTGRFERVN